MDPELLKQIVKELHTISLGLACLAVIFLCLLVERLFLD
jgi:hypothetical protein